MPLSGQVYELSLLREPILLLLGEATGGLEAIEKVHQFSPDVIVLDISMPDIDGIEVITNSKG